MKAMSTPTGGPVVPDARLCLYTIGHSNVILEDLLRPSRVTTSKLSLMYALCPGLAMSRTSTQGRSEKLCPGMRSITSRSASSSVGGQIVTNSTTSRITYSTVG